MNTCCWPCDRFAISSELKGYCLCGILPPAYLQSSSYIYEARYKDKEDKDPSLRRISDDWVKTEKVPLDLKRKGKGLLTELKIKLLFCFLFQMEENFEIFGTSLGNFNLLFRPSWGSIEYFIFVHFRFKT